MKLTIYQVDAFSDKVFEGNPAAICPLNEWISDENMQNIAMENNLSETAFFTQNGDVFDLRWFTPTNEVDLCGHATLASAHIIFNHLNYDEKCIRFNTKSGELKVYKHKNKLLMDFPAVFSEKITPPKYLFKALGIEEAEVYKSDDYMVVLDNENAVLNINPDYNLLASIQTRGIIVTSVSEEFDFVSRFFAPAIGVPEDPVTGSAHTKLVPYWSKKLGKKELYAKQLSQRGGVLWCKMKENRVEIEGSAVTYLIGEIHI